MTIDPGIPAALTAFFVILAILVVGSLVAATRARRARTLDRLAEREVWRADWLVGETLDWPAEWHLDLDLGELGATLVEVG